MERRSITRTPNSATLAFLSLGFGLALLTGLGLSSGSSAPRELVDRQDLLVLRERIDSRATIREQTVQSVGARLRRNGLVASDVEAVTTAIRRRLSTELNAFADSLRGRRFDSLDDAEDAIRIRERILCHDAIARPRRFARGRALTFVVDQGDADEFLREVDARIAFREVNLRNALRELSARRRMTLADEYAVGTYARMRANAAARTAIEEIRGAPFFSRVEASSYVGNAIDAELERILTEIRDRSTRERLLEKARSRGSNNPQTK